MAASSEPVSSTAGGGPQLDDLIGHRATTLRMGTPKQAGLLPGYADKIPVDNAYGSELGSGNNGHQRHSGSVVLAARNGVIAEYAAGGYNLRYADWAGTELPRDQWIPATKDTLYDLASLTKLFTSIVAMQLVDRGRLDLDATVASYLPAFAANGKQAVTIRQLLTHTSGLPPDPVPGLWTYPSHEAMVNVILTHKLQAPPGTTRIYADLNMLSLQLVVESLTGKTLDVLVREGITGPLKMTDTMFNPPASLKYRIAAEEYESTENRGLVWGEVHDENAWALGGVAGHAGLFSTAHDMAILCQMMLNGGKYGAARILSRDSVLAMLTDSPAIPGPNGLGFELNLPSYQGALATPYTFGHTGFTGTSIVVDPTTQSFVVLLTNNVHPNRDILGPIAVARRTMAYDLARAIPVRPATGQTAWYAGMTDQATTTLTLPVSLPASSRLDFQLWYDTEPNSDMLFLEQSGDGGQTWSQLPFHLSGRGLDVDTAGAISGYQGRQWLRATADLPTAGDVQLRWRYTTDPSYLGRGVYVDDVTIRSGHRKVFDDRRPADAATFQPDGWVASRD
ncbi:serine hydrolase domain-containing protein [Nakamurella lactea]|uniref:serine hydrolase domain-containing protein n=1 Tax=Nakamurella lactea TaxID=459515 RepID=UPI001B7FA535|nr:serine hydrolase domain-containing protein [Nakamurella lactea]